MRDRECQSAGNVTFHKSKDMNRIKVTKGKKIFCPKESGVDTEHQIKQTKDKNCHRRPKKKNYGYKRINSP